MLFAHAHHICIISDISLLQTVRHTLHHLILNQMSPLLTNQCTDDDITNKFTQHLPLYVVNCFLAAGCDTTEVIADMHVTNKAGDSLETIEDYIYKQYS